jgi:hypothetical protein
VNPETGCAYVNGSNICNGGFIVQPPREPNPPPCNDKPAKAALGLPLESARVNTQRVPLAWDRNACASNYLVSVCATNANGSKLIERTQGNGTTHRPEKLRRGKTYLWTGRACNGWDCAKGVTRSFITE